MNAENIDSIKKFNGYDDTLQGYKVICKDSSSRVYLVPINTDNTDYQAVLEWAAIDGNTIAEAD
tara:strand:+ start:1048 stop:1239 length:192 start_codon:yes stop_codon:yes gene_type:complete